MTRLLVMALLVALVVPVMALDIEPGECDSIGKLQLSVALTGIDFGDKYKAIASQLKEPDIAGGALLDIISDASELHEEWWSEAVPEFPDCTLADQTALVGGRVIDELLIASSVGQVAFAETIDGDEDVAAKLLLRFRYHVRQWTNLQDDFLVLVEAIAE